MSGSYGAVAKTKEHHQQNVYGLRRFPLPRASTHTHTRTHTVHTHICIIAYKCVVMEPAKNGLYNMGPHILIIQLFIRRNYWRYTSEAILNICRIRVCVCVVHDDKCEP